MLLFMDVLPMLEQCSSCITDVCSVVKRSLKLRWRLGRGSPSFSSPPIEQKNINKNTTTRVWRLHEWNVRYTRGSQVVTTVQSVQASERLRECVRQSSLLLPLREHLYYLKSHWNFWPKSTSKIVPWKRSWSIVPKRLLWCWRHKDFEAFKGYNKL